MPSLGDFFNWAIGIGDSIGDWITFTFRGDSVTAVLAYLRVFISYLPDVILDLGFAAFGGVVVLAILKSIGR